MNLSHIASLRFALALPTTLLMYLFLASCATEGDESGDNRARHAARRIAGQKQSYSTNFLAIENPISEGGKWINGGTTGRDWGNVQTIPGLAFGTTMSGAPPYNDSAAVLAGTWGPNQIAQATVYTVNQSNAIAEEVELLLRTTITAHGIKGYEFDYRVTSDGSQYLGIVRWNGRLNDFTNLTRESCATGGPGLHHGDTVMATAIGSTLSLYINGTKYCEATDTSYTGGSPGMGFWNWGGTVEDNKNYGFTNFTASDGQ